MKVFLPELYIIWLSKFKQNICCEREETTVDAESDSGIFLLIQTYNYEGPFSKKKKYGGLFEFFMIS